jgi:hypothetical protein
VASSEQTDALALLARVPSLAGQPRQVTELAGGLTNRNFKVTTPDGVFVARLFADANQLLAIDRDHEYRNSVIAAAAGVGAPVIEYRPVDRVLVLGYLDGRTLTNADVAEFGTLDRIAVACRALHAADRFAVPPGYDALQPAFAAARAALSVRDEGTVPCNNDLLAANFIDTGDRIWLIDYEYSGNNDPCFELGNIAGECGLDADAIAHLVTRYYGRPRRSRIARARLFSLVSRYGWTLWGAIQHASSPLAFDFWSWAIERFEAAASGFTAPGFDDLLADVAEED